ncbi:cytochrome P450 [Streptomyces sp. NPDC057702]|uniref:cytochrome P450 n=1 Tax=unclassified Streptomyces TaxID=2593676 RepID=UPI0036A439F3
MAASLLLPAVAAGAARRRPAGVALGERVRWGRRAVETLDRLRATYGDGPLLLRFGGRAVALPLTPDDVRTVLDRTPTIFSPTTWNEPDPFPPPGAPTAGESQRAKARRLDATASGAARSPLHHLAPVVVATVRAEAAALLRQTARTGELTWDDFDAAWWRTVRRLVLGDAARDDTALAGPLGRPRPAGDWSVLRPRQRHIRDDFLRRLRQHAADAGPDTLAGALATRSAGGSADGGPDGSADAVVRLRPWWFAYDAAATTVPRTLALLATHPAHEARARAEIARGGGEPGALSFTRACALETARLWPSTPSLLRESTEETRWRGRPIAARTTFVVHTPYFQRFRAGARQEYADRYTPEIWLDGRAARNPALVPFGGGTDAHAGTDLVPLTVTTWLAALLEGHTFQPPAYAPRPGPDGTLPVEFPTHTPHFTARPTGV